MTRFPHSANHNEKLFAAGHFFGAADIRLAPGVWRRSNQTAQRRAGSAIDLAVVATLRREGNLDTARARLEFARAVRLALT